MTEDASHRTSPTPETVASGGRLPTSRRALLRAAGAGTLLGLAGCTSGGSSSGDPTEQARDSLSAYTDVGAAIETGYEMTTPYIHTDEGLLGLPFVRLDQSELEPETPQLLFYDLDEEGQFELLGGEWLVPADSADEPPTLFGETLEGPMDGHSEFIPEHYGLHAWPFGDNPEGTFARYHAGVEPPSYIDELETAWEALTPYFTNEALAEEDGYTVTEECVTTGEGDYGVPVYDAENAGTDLTAPAVLSYRLSSTWNYRLLGAEWSVPADSTDEPPTLFGQPFDGPMDDHVPGSALGRHFGLHAWLFLGNPNGMFAPYNPALDCSTEGE